MARINTAPTLITLDNGLRLVHIHHRSSASALFGIVVGAGSADDGANAGLAHFVEHTIFKGTARRSSWHIINRMEAIGGELNAYTSKEETVVYSLFPGSNAARAVELIADLAINSRFPATELDKEREVVLDEIDSYLDNPSEAVFDLFEERLLAPSPLAHNILGTRESVRGLGSDDCRRFLECNYTTGNTVAFYSGPQTATTVAALVGRYFAAMPAGERRHAPGQPDTTAVHFETIERRPTHQAHVVTGVATPGLYSDERYEVALLANITGGPGMNSLLNVALRERRGLVYNVEASTAFFSTGGYMSVYFGCDPADMERCSKLCRQIFADIAEGKTLTPRRLAAAKKQYLGQLAVASENRENTIVNAARATLFYGRPADPAKLREHIMQLDPTHIMRRAETFAQASLLAFVPEEEGGVRS